MWWAAVRCSPAATDAKVYSLNSAAGALKWSVTMAGAMTGGVPVANGVVYATANGTTCALAASYGGTLITFGVGSAYGEPVVVDGTMTIG
jgi:outer membrane protein assembly factor BamB